ncbi:MAG: outer membrane beta-barrel protein [Ignavibacteriaceae bacterium]|nr:outer membrane beta-barrel protein [Ignavibacteriaceae bacterium]
MSFNVFAQNIYVTGKISDAETKNHLSSANVLLYHLPDSLFIGTTSNTKGVFKIDKLKPGTYSLCVKYLGYETSCIDLLIGTKSVNLGEIYLTPQKIKLDDVLIVDKVPVAVQSGDTTVYNADAFKVNKDAVAEDLLVKIPGVQVENGKVKAQGEEVKKVFVDGKTFFGEDPNIALKNIPAEIIQKVQVFDQQTDQAQFGGFDDGSTSKAINIITRMGIENGTFGKLLAGYGSDEKYNVNGDVNIFNEDQRLSLLGQVNNTNEQNFSVMDMLGVMGGMPSGGRMAGMGDGMMNRPGPTGGEPNLFLGMQNGITDVKGFGVNYNKMWEDKSEIGGSYFFNNTDNDVNTNLVRDYFTGSNGGQKYYEDKLSETKNTNHRFNLRVDYKIDSLNEIRFIPSFSVQKNLSSSFSKAATSFLDNQVNESKNFSSYDLKGLNLSSMLMYKHKFNSEGRTLTVGINTSYKKNDGTKKQLSESIFYGANTESDTIDQQTDILNDGITISSNAVYTEPINENNFLMLNVSHSRNTEKNDKKTFDYSLLDKSYSLFNTLLSNEYQKKYSNTSFGIGYRYKKNKISINSNLNYDAASLKSEQVYPQEYTLSKKFYSFLPSVMFRYNISRDKNLNIMYRAMNTAPSVTQLQNVLDNSNPLQLSVGNPDLKQEHGHSLTARWSTINFRNMHSIFLMLNGTYKNNYIGTNTIIARNDTMLANGIILGSGAQLSTPQNIDGYVSAQSILSYGLPADFIYSNLNLNLSFNYIRAPGIINNLENHTNTFTYGLGAVIASNVSTDFDFLISSTSYYNLISNSFSKTDDEDYLTQLTRIKLYWLLFNQIVIQGELNHKYDGGLSQNSEPSTFTLNASVGMKLFSDNSGELRLSAYDVLNQNTNIARQTTDYYTQESSSNVIGRYWLLSFVYNLRSFN